MADDGGGNIKVVVRCRPLNSRELARGAKPLIKMQGNQTILEPPEAGATGANAKGAGKGTMHFSFDKSYWSAGPRDEPGYCSQQTLFDDLGNDLLNHAFGGFNACIFAYGQTGSGKSYSMMGYGADKGIIPLTCNELFVRLDAKAAADPNMSFTVEVSYIEIYNEKVRDLLNPKNSGNLRVREHPSLGPYVEDLSKLAVKSNDEVMTLMDEGNKARTVAATNMNETSSRSHAVFTLILTMKRHDSDTNLDTEKVSRINLVDLAGSERANSTGATGQRLKEGANINKSLTTLGKVISSLALASNAPAKGKKSAADFTPYRDSVLTWLLKDSLGGNSKTAMIAAISPADYEETLSTLRYADQAKKIKNKAVINEDPNAKLVRELKEELEMLRARVGGAASESTFDPSVPPEKQKVTYQTKDGEIKTVTKADLVDQLQSSEKLMQSLNETWEQKLERTTIVQKEREKALEELGITVEKNNVGVHTPKKAPHLVNLNEDPLMSECLIYQLKEGRTTVGGMETDKVVQIRLSGESILDEHCFFENKDGKVTLHALPGAKTFLNGRQISPDEACKLRSGYRVILGDHHVFRFNNPEEVRKQRHRATMKSSSLHTSITAEEIEAMKAEGADRPASPASSEGDDKDVDWTYAKREAALAKLGLDPAIDSLRDEDLNKLYERVTMVKSMRDLSARPRPESSLSLSQQDDVWSENGRNPFGADALTDDTSVDAGGASPDAAQDAQASLEDKTREVESRLHAIAESSAEAEDLKEEKEQMEMQLKLVQAHMKRLIEARARGEPESADDAFEPVLYSARQLRMIRRVLDKWRAHRAFSMAETVLSNAALLKEANVLARELRKDVSYNFTIASGGALAAPASSVAAIAGLDDFADVADPVLASATQPAVAVKVLDYAHRAIYVWSLDRLQQQVQRMRNLTAFIDRPAYSLHFSADEPFYNVPAPEYSFVGNALVALAPLSRRLSSTSTVPIFDRYTAEAIGSCRVDIKLVSVVAPTPKGLPGTSAAGSAASTRAGTPSTNEPKLIPVGSKISFFLTVDAVKGLAPHDFSSAHLQTRLSAFVGSSLKAEEMYASNTVDLARAPPSDLKFRRAFSLVVTSKVLQHLRTGYAPIELFAVLKPQYLERMERWDELREQKVAFPQRSNSPSTNGDDAAVLSPAASYSAPASSAASTSSGHTSAQPQPTMRRSENDFVMEQTHDVVAYLQVRELAPDGSYAPVPLLTQGNLDPGAFSLHQGLQRRLSLTLTSNSGKQLPWTDVVRVRVGNIRLLDAKGRVHESSSRPLVTLPLLAEQTLEFRPDGSALLQATALWDSSVHDSALLNRVTGSGQRVLLQITWSVAVENCAEPVQFSMDMAVTMQTRDARPPSKIVALLSSTRILQKSSSVFRVRLSPPLTRSAKELWRLDTSEKYVRGEEVLSTWRPRGLSVVEDYARLVTMERRAADVQAVRVVLAHSPAGQAQLSAEAQQWARQDVLAKALTLWQKRFGAVGEIVLSQEPATPAEPTTPPRSARSKREPREEPMQLVASTKLMPRSDIPTKSGHLNVLLDATNDVWERRWFVLRRPYLHVYKHSNEVEEISVISLDGVNVEYNPDLESLYGRPFTFTLFTSSNSHALAAPSLKELQSWTSKLDPTRLPS